MSYVGAPHILKAGEKNDRQKGVTIQSASLRCGKYNDSSPCKVKRLYDMTREIGYWGLAPLIGLWPLLVFFAPVPEKEKIKIFLVSIGVVAFGVVAALTEHSGPDGTAPSGLGVIEAIILIPLAIAYFYLSYKGLIQENKKRNALYATLGDVQWRRASYCVVHDQVISG